MTLQAIALMLSLVALGLSLPCAWMTRQLRIRAEAITTKAEQVAALLTTCTTERDQARMEADALRSVLERMGHQVSITWTDKRMETKIDRTPAPPTRGPAWPWMN